mmetsp:Transcript_15273/g.42312  ORF Transcript_15273/g.42312 Transcript_15273/m.42312 type:complete len:196 (-) Transcript_15273:1208-1795(-)
MMIHRRTAMVLRIMATTAMILVGMNPKTHWVVALQHLYATEARQSIFRRSALSDAFLENDLVAVHKQGDTSPRLCAVKPDGSVAPLCQREDDVETDLFCDPREFNEPFWTSNIVSDEHVVAAAAPASSTTTTYGEGFYGQRPVPSLGGGPGYGAEADEIWSVTDDVIERARADGVDLPLLDMGIAHGEKARAGAF